MAERNPRIPHSIESLLFVNRNGKYCGYKLELISDNIGADRREFLICAECKGISRRARQRKGNTVCEVCVPGHSMGDINKRVGNTVASLKAICPLSGEGCDWEGKLGGIEQHMEECLKVRIERQLECGISIGRGTYEQDNREACPFKKNRCDYCNQKVHARDENRHIRKCEYNPDTEVPCPYKELGCEVIVLRKNRGVHITENMDNHNKLMSEQIEQLNQLKNRNQQLERTKQQQKYRNEEQQRENEQQKNKIEELERVKQQRITTNEILATNHQQRQSDTEREGEYTKERNSVKRRWRVWDILALVVVGVRILITTIIGIAIAVTHVNNLKANANQPETNSNQPETNSNRPKTNSNQPKTNSNQPETNSNRPKTNSNQPETNSNRPKTNSNQPETNSNQPKTNSNQPETNSNQPKTNSNQPETNSNRPKTNSNRPKTNSNQPKTNSNQPETNSNQPKTNSNQPETNSNRPKTNANRPKTNSNRPKTNANQAETNSNQPKTNSNQPETNSNQPETNSNRPETNANQAETNSNQPKTNSNRPKTNANQAETNSNQPKTNSNRPKTNANQAETNSNETKTNSNQPETNSNQPLTNLTLNESLLSNTSYIYEYIGARRKFLPGIEKIYDLTKTGTFYGPIFYLGQCKLRLKTYALVTIHLNYERYTKYFVERLEGEYDGLIDNCIITCAYTTFSYMNAAQTEDTDSTYRSIDLKVGESKVISSKYWKQSGGEVIVKFSFDTTGV